MGSSDFGKKNWILYQITEIMSQTMKIEEKYHSKIYFNYIFRHSMPQL